VLIGVVSLKERAGTCVPHERGSQLLGQNMLDILLHWFPPVGAVPEFLITVIGPTG
jgi:hypothetical protein